MHNQQLAVVVVAEVVAVPGGRKHVTAFTAYTNISSEYPAGIIRRIYADSQEADLKALHAAVTALGKFVAPRISA